MTSFILLESKQYNKLVNKTEMKQTHGIEKKIVGGTI